MERTELNDSEVIDAYLIKRMTMRAIAKVHKTNHHVISRILEQHNISKRSHWDYPHVFSAEHRMKISKARKGKTSPMKGTKQTEENRRKNMAGKPKLEDPNFSIDHFTDLDKYKFLSTLFSREKKYLNRDGTSRQAFVDKFYFDPQFNLLYLNWIVSDKCKWAIPSLDHRTPVSRGGKCSLDNLQFLSWFENKAKAEMTVEEWENFKATTCTSSKLFIGGQ
ncbi:MAG: NUMOD3 domain-containing DNA-binding protein [Gemmatales bacterium]